MALLSATPILVTDFDGTMTQNDFYQLAQKRLVAPDTPDYWSEYLDGRLTHFEALRRIFLHIHAPEPIVVETARAMELDAQLPDAVARLQTAGWRIVVASAGCNWYISRLLAEQGINNLSINANPGSYHPSSGLVMSLPENSPFLNESTGIDKAAVVRDALSKHSCVAFAGDGRPDLPAAMLVPPERRFARGWLADYLSAERTPYHPFTCWSEIAEILLEGVGRC